MRYPTPHKSISWVPCRVYVLLRIVSLYPGDWYPAFFPSTALVPPPNTISGWLAHCRPSLVLCLFSSVHPPPPPPPSILCCVDRIYFSKNSTDLFLRRNHAPVCQSSGTSHVLPTAKQPVPTKSHTWFRPILRSLEPCSTSSRSERLWSTMESPLGAVQSISSARCKPPRAKPDLGVGTTSNGTDPKCLSSIPRPVHPRPLCSTWNLAYQSANLQCELGATPQMTVVF